MSKIQRAISNTISPDVVKKNAGMQGYYEGTAKFEHYIDGYMTAICTMGSKLGLSDADLTILFETVAARNETKQ